MRSYRFLGAVALACVATVLPHDALGAQATKTAVVAATAAPTFDAKLFGALRYRMIGPEIGRAHV